MAENNEALDSMTKPDYSATTGDKPVIYNLDPFAATAKEIEEFKQLVRLVRKDRRTLLIAPRYDGNGGLHFSLTLTAKELRERKK